MEGGTKSLYDAWLECCEFLNHCREELLNAESMAHQARIKQCRSWVQEAEMHERTTREAMTNAAGQNGDEIP